MSDRLPDRDVLKDLRSRWDEQSPEAAIEEACRLWGMPPAKPGERLVLGRMLLEAGRVDDAWPLLLSSARSAATRGLALTELVPVAPDEALPEVRSLFLSLPAEQRARDETRYAFGLALWRSGEGLAALQEWGALSAPAKEAVADPLRRAGLEVASRLLAEHRFTGALEALDAIDGASTTAGAAFVRALAAEALQNGEIGAAKAAVERLRKSSTPFDQALRAHLEPAGAQRQLALEHLAEDSHDPDVREWARLSLAAELTIENRPRDALRILPESPGSRDGRILRTLLAVASGEEAREPAAADWATLVEYASQVPALVSRLLPEPKTTDPQAAAAYWLRRGQHERACAKLASAQRQRPWDARLARNIAAISYARALRAAPAVDEEAWRQCIAQLTCCLENPRWIENWVLERLTAYDAAEDVARRVEELKVDLNRLLSRSLNQIDSAARTRGEHSASDAVQDLQAALVREGQAATALWEAGGLEVDGSEPLAAGPLFVEQTGLNQHLVEFFRTRDTEAGGVDADVLLELLRAIGVEDELMSKALESRSEELPDRLRRWFSELGWAAARQRVGDVDGARARALDALTKWTPPDLPDAETFRLLNPAYAPLADGMARLRRDAAGRLCETSLDALERDLAHPGFDMTTLAARIRRILNEAAMLEQQDKVRYDLTRLILGQRMHLLEAGSLSSLGRASVMLAGAAATGLEGMERANAHVAAVSGRLLADRKHWRRAVECFEEAWRHEQTEAVAHNLFGLLLQWHSTLAADGRASDAQAVFERAGNLADEARELFPESDQLENLPMVLDLVRNGVSIGDLMTVAGSERPEAPGADALPGEAIEALRACRDHWSRGDLQDALDCAERARQAAPQHPDTVSLAAKATLELARQGGSVEGEELFVAAQTMVEEMHARYPDHPHLEEVAAITSRDRVLYAKDPGPIEELHCKGLRLQLAGRFGEAVEALKVVFALSEPRDPEVCSLLAACLTEAARKGSDLGEARKHLAAAERLLAVGREMAPDHHGMEKTRRRLAAVRARTRRASTGGA